MNEEDLKVAEPQAVKGVSPYYYFYDGQGSVGSFTGSSGADIGSYGYDAFGRDIDHSGVPGGNAYKFSTKEFEPISGMYYFGGRYYDPDAGRWLTPDPIGMADGLNKYLYVHNDPVNLVDPEGYCGENLLSGIHSAQFANGALQYGSWYLLYADPLLGGPAMLATSGIGAVLAGAEYLLTKDEGKLIEAGIDIGSSLYGGKFFTNYVGLPSVEFNWASMEYNLSKLPTRTAEASISLDAVGGSAGSTMANIGSTYTNAKDYFTGGR